MDKDKITFSSDGKASLHRRGNINVLHLQGSRVEMAAQHVELLKEQAEEGLLPFMARYLVGHVKHQQTFLEQFLTRLVVEGICRRVASGMPKEELAVYHNIGAEIGLKPKEIDVALGSADTLLILYALGEKLAKFGLRTGLVRAIPFACSGVMALPERTSDGHLWHGRNMDYDGLGYWDDHHTIAFLKPTKGQPYGFVSTAGIHTAGLSAFNASGIFAAVNTSPTLDCSMHGEPLFSVMDRLIREARSFEDAVKLAEEAKMASGYNIHISHGFTGRAAVVETSYSMSETRYPEDDVLLVTNHYETNKMSATIPEHILVDGRNSRGRLERLRTLFRGKRNIDGYFIASSLRDRIDAKGEFHPLGDVVCNMMNLSSIVADVTAGKFWVAEGKAPVARGSYIGFDIHREWDSLGSVPEYKMSSIPADDDTKGVRCTNFFQEAHKSVIHDGEMEKGLKFTVDALKVCPHEPHLILVAALLSLAMNRVEDAKNYALKYTEEVPADDDRLYRIHLLLAWIAQLRKDRQTAVKEFALARNLAAEDYAVFEVEWWSRRSPLTEKGLRTFHVDMFNGKRLMF